jgi:hypothetical protein
MLSTIGYTVPAWFSLLLGHQHCAGVGDLVRYPNAAYAPAGSTASLPVCSALCASAPPGRLRLARVLGVSARADRRSGSCQSYWRNKR